jgi:16S rRNA (cytidine1402-2'-O)-methyltransferase
MQEGVMQTDTGGRLAPGLYVVATPIGAARDITLRALDVLAAADAIAAEDTRTLRRLLGLHGLAAGGRPVWAYHDRNGAAQRPRILAALAAGKAVALVSEAGTPLISDPGFALVRAARDAGHAVHPVPGPSAVVAALSVAGLPSDRFFFAGFPPAAAGPRKRFLEELGQVPGTLVFYESPQRVHRLLGELAERFGNAHRAALARELTKRFEDVMQGTLAELAAATAATPPRGEIVLLVDRPAPPAAADDATLRAALAAEMARSSRSDAADAVARRFGLPRRRVYRLALDMGGAE